MTPRFSLRGLLALITIAGVLCYWRGKPARIADRLVAAIRAGDLETADAMFQQSEDRFLAEFVRRSDRNKISADRETQSFIDWLAGTSTVRVKLNDRSGWAETIILADVAVSPQGATGPLRTQEVIVDNPAILGEPPELRR